VREHPELADEIEQAMARWEPAIVAGLAVPCCWYDPASRRCRHYDLRPEACQEFEPGEEDCLRFRAEHGID
jgi:Fe-S-cluster containining protein